MLVKPLVRPICRAIAGRPTASLGAGFAPTSLFADGSIGVLYDNSDLSTLFSDSAGTTAAVVNGPVGLQLDKSQGLVLGSNVVDNFNSLGTGWTWSGGVLEHAAGSSSRASDTTAVVADRWYAFTYTVTASNTGAALSIEAGSTAGFSVPNTVGTHTVYILSGNSNTWASFFASSALAITITNISVRELPGNHRYQSTATSRPTLRGTPNGLDGDGTDDSMLVASSGGGTTGFLFQSAIKLDAINKRQTLWSDAGTNTGYKVEINASNQLVFSAGNGTAYTSVTTANTVAAGTTYSVECYDDGTNLVAILNQGTPATASRPTVSAGTASFTMQKDNGAASGFMDGTLYSVIYLRNTAKNSATRAQSMRWIRQKAGL